MLYGLLALIVVLAAGALISFLFGKDVTWVGKSLIGLLAYGAFAILLLFEPLLIATLALFGSIVIIWLIRMPFAKYTRRRRSSWNPSIGQKVLFRIDGARQTGKVSNVDGDLVTVATVGKFASVFLFPKARLERSIW